MLLNLEKQYMAAWKGGDALAYRLIRHPAKSAEQVKEAFIEALSEHPAEDQP
jgi:hypothetical protein